MLLNDILVSLSTNKKIPVELVRDKANRAIFNDLVYYIQEQKELEMTRIVDLIPRDCMQEFINILGNHYGKYPYTNVAISKIKWRRGF